MNRFKDDGRTLYELVDNYLIKCPKCNDKAKLFCENKNGRKRRKISCLNCGYTKIIKRSESCNPKFWLVISCGKESIWACNEEHLAFLESFVQANLRERRQIIYFNELSKKEILYWSSQSFTSRLPKWIKDKKNRKVVLKAIARLKETL